MFDIVNCFSGKGKFYFEGRERIVVDLSFRLIQYSNAKIEIICFPIEMTAQTLQTIAHMINTFGKEETIIHMHGEVHEFTEGKIKVDEAYITTMNLDLGSELQFKLILQSFKPIEIGFEDVESKKDIKLCAGLTNFVFGKCPSKDKQLNGFVAKIEDYYIHFHQKEDYKNIVKSLEDNENPQTILVTSEAVIKYMNGKTADFSEILTKLSDLLSYACKTQITHIYENYYYGDSLFKIILRPAHTRKFKTTKNLIESNHYRECNLKSYLETSYPSYSEYVDKLGLNIVISFYLEGIYSKYVDMGFLLYATALETILSGYEELREEEGSPIVKGLIKSNKKKIIKIFKDEGLDLEGTAERVANEISYSNLSIHEKLSAFVEDNRFLVKLYKYDRDFSLIRNKIAHTGKFPTKIDYGEKERNIDAINECDKLIYLLDRIILSLLNYQEKPFYNKMDGFVTVL